MISPFDSGPLALWTFRDLGSETLPFVGPVSDHEDLGSFPSSVTRVAGSAETFIIAFGELARFCLDFENQAITAFDVSVETSESGLTHLLFDHIAPRILAHTGNLVLHGSAVEINGKLAVFLGDTGAGKSTMAASLHRAGHGLLGDDAVLVSRDNGAFFGKSIYPSLRLYPRTASMILGEEATVSPMAHYSAKQNVALSRSPETSALPIAMLFFLTGAPRFQGPLATLLPPRITCMRLIEQSFALDTHDPLFAAAKLPAIADVASCVPGMELEYPHDFDRLAEVHALIEQCMAKNDPDLALAI